MRGTGQKEKNYIKVLQEEYNTIIRTNQSQLKKRQRLKYNHIRKNKIR
jgi:hypothetical protein